jgi:hypothetical protein
MKVTSGQIARLRQAAVLAFEQELLEHMREFAPELHRLRGDAVFVPLIRASIERAQNRGFILRGPVRQYVEFVFVFGYGFDTDPMLHWAHEAQESDRDADEMYRAVQLHNRAMRYLNAVAGPGNSYAFTALTRLEMLGPSTLAGTGPLSDRILAAMASVYPEKFAAAGEPALRHVIAAAARHAQSLSLPADAGTVLLAGLMFGFGHEILRDPLYPWIIATLEDPRITDRGAAMRRLFDKVRTYAAAMRKTTG